MRIYAIAHKKFLTYAELNPSPLDQIFTKRTFFLELGGPGKALAYQLHKNIEIEDNRLKVSDLGF